MVGGIAVLPSSQDVTVEQYESSADTFEPVEWDPSALATIAREAGAGYVVLTAKHHSGFAMWPTELSDWSIARSPYPGDIVRDFVTGVRGAGLRVGLYFSLSDWHHPDYPAFTDADRPYRVGLSPPHPSREQWGSYHRYMTGQLQELLGNYGPIDLLWFDGGWERPQHWWKPTEVEALVRALQPEILINDRLYGVGDITTPEQGVPVATPTGRWETCMTMNESWGWVPSDKAYKSGRYLVHSLCEIASRGGNLLLNVSPTGTGAVPDEQVGLLRHVGRWMNANSVAIRATVPAPPAFQFHGPMTRAGHLLFLHCVARPYESVTVRGVPVKRVERAWLPASGHMLDFTTRTEVIQAMTPDPIGEVTISVSEDDIDPDATVIAVRISGEW